jgi:hypothetical protein
MGIAIVGGVIAFLVVGAIVSQTVVHDSRASAGFVSGAVAAAWCIWPALKAHQVERYNTLRPAPKKYQIPWRNAFGKVREILDRANYKMGSTWRVSTADTQGRHIHATLQFMDEEGKFEGTKVENIQYRTERVRRLVELDIQFQEQDDATIIQLDFRTQAEGNNPIYACDFVVEDIKNAIEREMGPGTTVGNPAEFVLEAPPWWLLGVTAFGLLNLWEGVMTSVFGK